MERIKKFIKKSVTTLIQGYQYCVSPMLGNCCRFYPNCSGYAKTAVERFGVLKGGVLSIQRILKCHPWHKGGEDFVPPKE